MVSSVQTKFVGMMQYDGDLKLPARFLVPPPAISGTSGELLAKNGVSTFACSETQKFGHVSIRSDLIFSKLNCASCQLDIAFLQSVQCLVSTMQRRWRLDSLLLVRMFTCWISNEAMRSYMRWEKYGNLLLLIGFDGVQVTFFWNGNRRWGRSLLPS